MFNAVSYLPANILILNGTGESWATVASQRSVFPALQAGVENLPTRCVEFQLAVCYDTITI
jgi:hypothetical protein